MTFTSDTEIEHIGEGLIACTLPKSEWTHAAHFAAAIWLLGHAANDPLTEMPELIRRYNLSVGTPNTDTDGYHETITIASLLAAKYILSTRKTGEPIYAVVNRLIASEYGKPSWILNYWTKDTLFSVKARKHWTEPNVQPLPW